MHNEEQLKKLSEEVKQWDSAGFQTKSGFQSQPELVPRVSETTLISIRIPNKLLHLLKAAATEQEIGYQVLMKRWLEDRLRQEFEERKAKRKATQSEAAPQFPRTDVPIMLHIASPPMYRHAASLIPVKEVEKIRVK